MKLLVTGATGFVGFEFVKTARKAGHTVMALVRHPAQSLESIGVDTLVCDIRDIQPSHVQGYDAIVHMATATSGDANTFSDVTVGGTETCLSAALEALVPRFIHISSASVYPGRLPAPIEDSLRIPLDPHPESRGMYAQSKIGAEQTVAWIWRSRSPVTTEITIVRPGMVFGRNMRSVLAGTAVEAPGGIVLGLGRPKQPVPYIHVDDLSAAILGLLTAEWRPGQLRAFDAFTQDPPSKADLVRMHGYFTGRSRRAIWPPRPVIVGLAHLAELALTPLRPDNAIGYKVARYFDLDATQLPVSHFWQGASTTARVAPADAVCEALTVDRVSGDSQPDPIEVANDHLAAADPSPPLHDPGWRHKIVIVGAGRVVDELHVPAIRSLGLRVAGVVDRDRRAAARLASVVGCVAYPSLEEVPLPSDSEGTAVIATPGPTHAHLVEDAVGLGWNVLLEKPAATSRADYEASLAAVIREARTATVMQNYRFRAAAMSLWRVLSASDLGTLVGATAEFHMGRIATERASWSRDDRVTRAAIMELAIHFIDIICSLTGVITPGGPALVTRRSGNGDTVSVTASGRSAGGAHIVFSLGYSGAAQRTRLLLEFERSTVELGFFPEGCRVMPRRNTPIDDAAYAVQRLARLVASRLPSRNLPVAPNAAGHLCLYRHHLRRTTDLVRSSVCDLASIRPTMETAYALSALVYEES